eukprot:1193201-Prorocentrum_minimum.AAC.1
MTDQSDAARTGTFARRTNRTQDARVYSHDGPFGRRTRGYILTTDQSDAGRAGRAGIFSRRTNRTLGIAWHCAGWRARGRHE